MVEFSSNSAGHEDDIAALFEATFSASEGAEEGALIGALARSLMETTDKAKLRVFTARDKIRLCGAVIFTPLVYADDTRQVMLLSPMAVAPDAQGQGIGQELIRYGLDTLRAEGVDIAITYGDPAFYGKLGFAPLDQAVAPPPFPLSQPIGWIGQSLSNEPITPLKGPVTCAPALSVPTFW